MKLKIMPYLEKTKPLAPECHVNGQGVTSYVDIKHGDCKEGVRLPKNTILYMSRKSLDIIRKKNRCTNVECMHPFVGCMD